MKTKLAALFVALLFCAASARADQIGTIRSGSFTAAIDQETGMLGYSGGLSGLLESGVPFTFGGSGAAIDVFFPNRGNPYEPGGQVFFTAAAFGSQVSDDLRGSFTAGDVRFRFGPSDEREENFGGVEFTGGSALIPTDGRQVVTLRAPVAIFAVAGSEFFGFEPFNLYGEGLAELVLVREPDSELYRFDSITYTTTPEPATMILLGTGLVGIGGMVRKRRQVKAD